MKTTKNLLSIFLKKSKESTCSNITLSDIKQLGLLWGPKSPLGDIGNFQRKVVCVAGRN
jgi:hypothetical protein